MPIQNCIIIHGCTSVEEDISYDRHWIPWTRETLSAQGIATFTPTMPEPWRPDYEKWKEELEKLNIDEHTALVGHSCGAAFLVRWLGDSKRRVSKLILVAPWKIAGEQSLKKPFYEYPIDGTIASRVGEIVMFTADNEEDHGKESLKIFHDALGGEIVLLKGHGHYTFDDMQTEEFPELLEKIVSNGVS